MLEEDKCKKDFPILNKSVLYKDKHAQNYMWSIDNNL